MAAAHGGQWDVRIARFRVLFPVLSTVGIVGHRIRNQLDSKTDEKWLDQHAEASKEWCGVLHRRVMRMLVVDPAPFLACSAATPPLDFW